LVDCYQTKRLAIVVGQKPQSNFKAYQICNKINCANNGDVARMLQCIINLRSIFQHISLSSLFSLPTLCTYFHPQPDCKGVKQFWL